MATPEVTRPTPSRRWRRRIKRIILGLFALVVVAVATVLIALHTSWGRDQLRAQIEAKLKEEFPGGVKVGSVTGSVFGELAIHGIEINGMDRRPMLTIAKLRVDVALAPLLRKRARVDHLIVEDVLVDIRPQPPTPERRRDPSSWSIELPDLQVRRAAIAIAGTEGRAPIHLDAVGVYATAALGAGLPIEAGLGVMGTWRERDATFGITASARIVNGVVVIPSLFAYAGGVTLAGAEIVVNPDAPTGTVTVIATPAAVAQLAPAIALPADLAVSLAITRPGPRGAPTHVDVVGRFGDAHLQASLDADLRTRAGSGVVFVDVTALGPLTQHAVEGRADVTLAFVGDATAVRGMLAANARLVGAPRASTFLAFDTSLQEARARLAMIAGGEGALATALAVDVVKSGTTVTLERAHVVAAVADPTAASGGRVLAEGALEVEATASGPLSPTLAVTVSGTTRGSRVRYNAATIAALEGRFAARLTRKFPVGRATLQVRGITNAGAPFGSATVTAVAHADETIAVVVQARPRPATTIDLDAVVTPGPTTTIELGKHRVQLPGGRELAGAGGRVTIDPAAVVATGIVSTHRGGRIELGARLGRETGELAAELAVTRMPVAVIEPTAQGDASVKLAVARRAGRWGGSGTVAARGVVLDQRISIDGDARVSLVGRRVSLGVHTTLESAAAPRTESFSLTTALHGGADVALELDGPRDITDPRGWLALTRKDLRVASITLRAIDLGALGGAGSVDGTILMSPTDTHGSIEIRGVPTPAGPVTADLSLDNIAGDIAAHANATLEGVGVAQVDGRIALPERLFDPLAWKLLGRGAVRSLTARLDDVLVEPALLERFGIDRPYHGRVNLGLAIGAGLASVRLTLDADGLHGGPVVAPLDLHAVAELDGDDTTAVVDVFATTPTRRTPGDETGKLVHLTSRLPVTFERWIAGGYPAARTAELRGTLEIPRTQVATLLAIVGRTDVVAGTLDGAITLGGTLAVPTANATIVARGVTVRPLITGKIPPVLDELKIKASWLGAAGSVELTGSQSDGGRLRLAASGRPDALTAANASLDIAGFEIAPLAAFLPGGLVATSGKLAGEITARGLDPATARVRGRLVLAGGRLPLSPLIGTLRDTAATVKLEGRTLALELDGKLGACNVGDANACRTVHLEATADPDTVVATMDLDHVQLINAIQPVITAQITAKLERAERWTGDVRVRRAVVQIPRQSGTELLASALPTDMVFVDSVTPVATGPRPPPVKPWLVTDVVIESTRIEADELRGTARGRLEIAVGGESIGMLGAVETEQGIADVFGHRYQLDHGRVTFDGTTDALLDIRLVHDFSTVTLYADVGGRISNPVLAMSSEPATYTEGQLLGFFLGGTPGGDPNSETRDAAAGAGTSLLSQRIGRTVNRVLPVQIDVFNCSVSTSQSSAACTVGKWLNEKLFVAYKQHLEARPDENSGEGRVEYYLRKDTLVEGNIGDRNYNGIDLLWRHRW